jgi:hypothetical protein
LHILIRLYDLYSIWIRIVWLVFYLDQNCMTCILFGSSPWLCNTCDVGMPHLYPYLELHISLIRSRVKKDKLMPWWGLHTLSDLRESFEEPGRVIFWKKYIAKNPSYLDRRSRGDLDQGCSSHQPPKATW